MRSVLVASLLLTMGTGIWAAEEVESGKMLVGKQILEITDNRQLTLRADGNVEMAFISPNGSYVVYYIGRDGRGQCRLAKTSTGKTITIMDAPSCMDEPGDWPPAGVTWIASSSPAWAPDSSQFALAATHFTREGDAESQEMCVLIYSASGATRKTLPLSETDGLGGVLFSPDSKKLLMRVTTKDTENSVPGGQRLKDSLQLMDIGTGARSVIYTGPFPLDILGWSNDGSLLCVAVERSADGERLRQLHKIAPDGSSSEVIAPDSPPAMLWSPDSALSVSSGGTVAVKDRTTGKQVEIAKDGDFSAWAPNGRMLFYERRESIKDESLSVRRRHFRSMWLATLQPGKMDRMCISVDAEGSPSCSRDCRRIAYMSHGQLYIAELTLREPRDDEKLAAGLLTAEEEMKQKLLENGKQIGVAITLYADDLEGKLPPADDIETALGPYLDLVGKDALKRPGASDMIFRYIHPGAATVSEIKDSASTLIGELDAGYDWIVEIYADGHVKVRQKQ